MAGIDRRFIQNFDWTLLFLTVAIASVAIVNLVSATAGEGAQLEGVALRQFAWFGMGMVAMLVMMVPDYRSLERLGPWLYVLGMFGLVAVMLFAPVVNGSQRWGGYGPLRLQPSEPMKLILVVMFARYLNRRASVGTPLGFLDLFVPALILAPPVALILEQPDLGTGTLLVLISGTLLLMTNIRLYVIGIAGVGAVAAGVVGWVFLLHDYQKDRVLTFLEPERDPLGAAYHAIQSQIAVGSGGLTGKGFREGVSQLGFLPEQQTDFAFSLFCEQWGFIGGATVLVLFACLILRGLLIARASKDPFGAYLALGVVGLFFWACTINVGMVVGVVPVVGVPLPFLSYGGSALITCMAAIGILMNISMRRYVF